MNAIPSEPRAPWTGRPGRPSFRDVALIMGPSILRDRASGSNLRSENRRGLVGEGIDGARQAMKAGRGVSVARQTVQGRVGHSSRHVALHLASHRLLLTPSTLKDADRPFLPTGFASRRSSTVTFRPISSRPEPQPLPGLWPRNEAGDTKLVTAPADNPLSSAGQSRGKGVLAA